MENEHTTGLFRKAAIKQASSAEQLDQPVQVVGPLGWLSLAIFWPIIALALIWSFVGRLPTTISGQGLLLRGGNLHSVVAQAGGQLVELTVDIGSDVEVGQVIGTISQPVLATQIAGQRLLVRQYEQHLALVTSNQHAALTEKLRSIEAQRQSAANVIADYQHRAEMLRKIVTAQEDLVAQGLITEVVFYNSRSQLLDVEENIAKTQNSLIEMNANEAVARDNAEQSIFQARNQLLAICNQLAELEKQHEHNSRLVSSYSGRVANIETLPGQNVDINTPVIDLEVEDQEMVAVLFCKAGQGKKIQSQMAARVSPATVAVEEYGYIRGAVTFVAEVPSSQQSIIALLRNPDVAQLMAKSGPPLRVDVKLHANTNTFSGFDWSSSKGPKIHITPGTLCSAQVVTGEQPPITLLIPLLKEFFGVVE